MPKKRPDPSRFPSPVIWTEAECGAALGTTALALRLRRFNRRPTAPPYHRQGRKIFYVRAEVLAWLAADPISHSAPTSTR